MIRSRRRRYATREANRRDRLLACLPAAIRLAAGGAIDFFFLPPDCAVDGVFAARQALGFVGTRGYHRILIAGVRITPLRWHTGAHRLQTVRDLHAVLVIHRAPNRATDSCAGKRAEDGGHGPAFAASHARSERPAKHAANNQSGLLLRGRLRTSAQY
jgi:hypothetical protein